MKKLLTLFLFVSLSASGNEPQTDKTPSKEPIMYVSPKGEVSTDTVEEVKESTNTAEETKEPLLSRWLSGAKKAVNSIRPQETSDEKTEVAENKATTE